MNPNAIRTVKNSTNKLTAITQYYQENSGSVPRIGVLVTAYNASDLLHKTLDRIPPEIYEIVEEVFVFDDASIDDTISYGESFSNSSKWKEKISIY